MSLTVLALLDRPSSRSMGMVPVLFRDADGQHIVSGLAHGRNERLSSSDVDHLRAEGHALWLNRPVAVDVSLPIVALWIGNTFTADSRRLNAPVPPIPEVGRLPFPGHGIASLCHPESCFKKLNGWVFRAARSAVARGDPGLAKLAAWALPDAIETRAAVWGTASRTAQESELAWFLKRETDSGRKATLEMLRVELSNRVSDLKHSRSPVILAVTGPAESAHKTLSTALASALNVTRLSFSDLIRTEVENRKLPVERRSMQDVGQELVARDPLLLSERLLSSSKDVPIVVVDSVRHASVMRALQYISGTRRVLLLGTRIDPDTQVKRLSREQGVGDLSTVLRHPTERQIRPMLRYADFIATDGATGISFDGEIRNAVSFAKDALSAMVPAS